MSDYAESYEELRQAGIRMQVAVGNVLMNGGLNIPEWWDKLVEAQQILAGQTQGKHADFDKYREDRADEDEDE